VQGSNDGRLFKKQEANKAKGDARGRKRATVATSKRERALATVSCLCTPNARVRRDGPDPPTHAQLSDEDLEAELKRRRLAQGPGRDVAPADTESVALASKLEEAANAADVEAERLANVAREAAAAAAAAVREPDSEVEVGAATKPVVDDEAAARAIARSTLESLKLGPGETLDSVTCKQVTAAIKSQVDIDYKRWKEPIREEMAAFMNARAAATATRATTHVRRQVDCTPSDPSQLVTQEKIDDFFGESVKKSGTPAPQVGAPDDGFALEGPYVGMKFSR